MATNHFTSGVLPTNFVPSVNSYMDLLEKITEQAIYNATGFNPLDFLNKGEWNNGTTLEQSVIELAQAYDFDGTAVDVFATANPNVICKLFKDWTKKQFEATISEQDIMDVLNADKSVEDVVAKVVNSLTEGEYYEDYNTMKALLAYAKDTSTTNYMKTAGTATTGADLIKKIKNAISAMKFTNNKYYGDSISLVSRAEASNLVCLIPSSVMNALDVDTLAHVYNLEKMGVLAEIHEIDTEDSIVYVFDKNAIGSRTRLKLITDIKNPKALKQNFFLTTSKLYYYSPIFKACWIDATAVA